MFDAGNPSQIFKHPHLRAKCGIFSGTGGFGSLGLAGRATGTGVGLGANASSVQIIGVHWILVTYVIVNRSRLALRTAIPFILPWLRATAVVDIFIDWRRQDLYYHVLRYGTQSRAIDDPTFLQYAPPRPKQFVVRSRWLKDHFWTEANRCFQQGDVEIWS